MVKTLFGDVPVVNDCTDPVASKVKLSHQGASIDIGVKLVNKSGFELDELPVVPNWTFPFVETCTVVYAILSKVKVNGKVTPTTASSALGKVRAVPKMLA